jgi:alpha-galactosidase
MSQPTTGSQVADLAMPFSLAGPRPTSSARRKPVKIGIIGAGSAQFSLNVVRDLCLTPGLAGSLVCFMDINAERLEAIDRLARRYAGEVGSDLRFETTLDREVALREADFILNTAAQPHDDEEHQRSVWDSHGYYRGVRLPYLNLELMLSIARDMERICPDAWLVQSGNPVFEGCTLMTRETGVKVVGLCHGHYGYRKIARVLGLDDRYIAFEAPGVNHCIWMTQFRYRGEDAYPLIDEWLEQKSADHWSTPVTTFSDTQMSRAAVDMYQMFGLFPIGDTPRFGGSQYQSSWWYHSDLATKQRWYGELGGFDSEIGWSRYLAKMNENLARIEHAGANHHGKLTDNFPPEHSGEQIVPIMDALSNDHQGIFQVNVPNHGALPGIAHDVVVEVPALVGRDGIKPIRTTALPQRLMHRVLVPKILEMEMNLDIFLTGDPKAWFHQILLDHRTRSPEQAIEAMQAVLDLPFNLRLRERFGGLHELMALAGKEEVLVEH